jgi:hypothetical protein
VFCVDGATGTGARQAVDTVGGREIDLDGFDLSAELLELAGGLDQLGLVSGDRQIDAMTGALLRQFVADSGRGVGDDRQWPGGPVAIFGGKRG